MKATVYIEHSHRFEEPKGISGAWLCHVLRGLCGPERSRRKRYLTLVDYLKSLGYERLKHDHYFFVHYNRIIIAIYVNYLLLLGCHFAKIGLL